jgi:hypothetical protein
MTDKQIEDKINNILKNIFTKIYKGDIERGWQVYNEFEEQLKNLITTN